MLLDYATVCENLAVCNVTKMISRFQ